MKFEQFQFLTGRALARTAHLGEAPPRYTAAEAQRLNALVLAYIGDAYFNLYVRTRMLRHEQNKVRVMHVLDARIVSAAMQAAACAAVAPELTEEETAVLRRGRNAQSSVPKSATAAEYRASTAFEALLGYLYLSENWPRLEEIVDRAFVVIMQEMTKFANETGVEK